MKIGGKWGYLLTDVIFGLRVLSPVDKEIH